MPAWLTMKLIGAVMLAALVAVLLLWGPAACQRMRSLGAQSKLDRGQGQAAVESGHDAVDTVGNVAAAATDSERLSQENDKEIRNAKGASVRVDPAVSTAGLRAFCKRPSGARTERCRVFLANPNGVAPAGAVR